MRAFVTLEIGAKNRVLDSVYPLLSLPSRSKSSTYSYRKLHIFTYSTFMLSSKCSPALYLSSVPSTEAFGTTWHPLS